MGLRSVAAHHLTEMQNLKLSDHEGTDGQGQSQSCNHGKHRPEGQVIHNAEERQILAQPVG